MTKSLGFRYHQQPLSTGWPPYMHLRSFWCSGTHFLPNSWSHFFMFLYYLFPVSFGLVSISIIFLPSTYATLGASFAAATLPIGMVFTISWFVFFGTSFALESMFLCPFLFFWRYASLHSTKPRSPEWFNHSCNRAVRLRTAHPTQHLKVVLCKLGTNVRSLNRKLKIASYVTKLNVVDSRSSWSVAKATARNFLPFQLSYHLGFLICGSVDKAEEFVFRFAPNLILSVRPTSPPSPRSQSCFSCSCHHRKGPLSYFQPMCFQTSRFGRHSTHYPKCLCSKVGHYIIPPFFFRLQPKYFPIFMKEGRSLSCSKTETLLTRSVIAWSP